MTAQQKTELLRVARATIDATTARRPLPPIAKRLTAGSCGGVFVTLRNEGRLRGCMGTFAEVTDIFQTIVHVAQLAAQDPRFVNNPIIPAELKSLCVEISILSPATAVSDPLSLELGVHGILIEQGSHRGCFLPHVAVEYAWTKEEFLSRCCSDKANLPADAWQDPQTTVSLFTTEVFAEP